MILVNTPTDFQDYLTYDAMKPTSNTVYAKGLLFRLGKCIVPSMFVLTESLSAPKSPFRIYRDRRVQLLKIETTVYKNKYNMKQLLFILSLLLFTTLASGQTWAPTGAKWTFGVGFAFNSSVEFREWTSTGDTLVNGHVCKVIKRYGSSVISDNSNQLITYEDSNKIYWYNKNQFTILYDFNKNAGETWTIMNDTCEVLITVDSTSIETINGFPLKVQYISSSAGAFHGKVLEHIGHVAQPNPDFNFHCYGIQPDLNYYTGLRCYVDSIFGYHNFGIAPSCNYTSTGIDNLENPLELNIFPNPSTLQLNIETNTNSEYQFKIYSSLGQLVKTGMLKTNKTTISIDELKKGIYNLELNDTSKTITKRFMVGN